MHHLSGGIQQTECLQPRKYQKPIEPPRPSERGSKREDRIEEHKDKSASSQYEILGKKYVMWITLLVIFLLIADKTGLESEKTARATCIDRYQ